MNKEILDAAFRAQPEMMKKTAMALSLIEKMTPEFLEDVLGEFEMIAEVTTEKVAAVPSASSAKVLKDVIGKHAIGVAALVGTGIAASLGTAIATDLFDSSKRFLTKSRNFRRIMAFDPSLKEVATSGNKDLKTAFNTLHRFAPDFASDPLLGAGLLRQLVNMPVGAEMDQITKLLGSRKNLQDIKKNQFQPNFRSERKDNKQKPGDEKVPGAMHTND